MNIRSITAAAILCLFPAQSAAAEKTAGNITLLGDAADYSSAGAGQSSAGTQVAGALAGAAYGNSGAGAIVLESGFYTRLVSSAAVVYTNTSISSYTLSLVQANPAGTTYDIFVSTWAMADPYMAYYSTDATGRPVEGLYPNTSFYNFVLANYMEGDYSAPAATVAVTAAVAPSSGPFTLADVGHNTLELSFAGFENPPPVPAPDWFAQTPALPAARYGQASVVYGAHVFISGGFDGIYFSSAVLRGAVFPDGSVGSWETAGFMPAGLYGHQMVAARGRLYILGGYASGGSRLEVWSVDISSAGAIGKWELETPLPSPMYFHAAALAGNKIYVSGGYKSGSGVLAGFDFSVIGNDGALGAWTSAGSLPAPLYAHSMSLLPGRLIIAGGKDGASARSEVWICPLAAGYPGACSAYTPLPAPRYGHRALTAANRLYIVGGNNGSAAQSQVFLTSVPAVGAAQWESAAPLTAPRQFAIAEIIGSRLQVFGGSNGSAASNSVFAAALRGTEYSVEVAEDNSFASGVKSSGWTSSPEAGFGGLLPGSTYYFRARARNWTGVETKYSPVGSTITYAAIPGTAPWTDVRVDSATANWLANDNPAGYSYQVLYSTSQDFNTSTAAFTTSSFITFNGLRQSTTYYARVRAYSPSGRSSRFAELPPARTTFDPALDVTSPTIANAQADFAGWKGTNTFLCDVDFADAGASGLSKFQLRVSTTLGDVNPVWADAVTGINQDLYTADWTISQNAWEAMLEGASNYISVRVYDNSGNYKDATDLFSVLKDSTPPVISVNYAAPAAWQTDYPGDITGLRFDDALSGLERVQYSVSSGKFLADGGVIPWTDLSGLTPGATWHQPAALTYSFNQLANATSNYFSFRAVDVAGSTRTFTDAFGIAKNISGPTVSISTPAAAWLSTFTWVSGNTGETNAHAVKGTEVSLRDLFSGLYYNAGDFLSSSRVWQDADDQTGAFAVTFNNLALTDGRQYQAVARSSDSAGDYSQLFATRTFTFDSAPPSARIVYPADGSSAASLSAISGTAADSVSGITAVEVVLRRLSDGKWWNNSASSWDSAPAPLLAGTTPYWTWNFQAYLRDSLSDGASYYASVRAADASAPANSGAFYAQGSTFTYYDATPPPPTATLAAVTGAFSGSVNLFWRAAGDNAVSGYLLSGAYKIAYSTYTGAQSSTASAQVSITTAAITAGATQFKTLSGFNASTSYYFTLWTADDAQNWSQASNEASSVSGAPDTGSLTGRVTDASTQPVTGVLVEALSTSGAVEGSDYTDAFGNYSIPALNSLYLTIRAVWVAQDIESSVSKDSIPNGSAGVNFTLSVTYQLASISGFIPSNFMPRGAAPQLSAGARYTTREVRASRGTGPFVEIYSRGRRIGAAFTDSAGAFEVPNLLPGAYGLRVYNGFEYSKMEIVTLRPGQKLVFTPKWELLNKAGVYAYPNPAGAAVNFHFKSFAAEAEVEVFDISGRLVKRLTNASYDSVVGGDGGSRKIYWDLSRENIASGVYLYILRVRDAVSGESEQAVKKFAVIR